MKESDVSLIKIAYRCHIRMLQSTNVPTGKKIAPFCQQLPKSEDSCRVAIDSYVDGILENKNVDHCSVQV